MAGRKQRDNGIGISSRDALVGEAYGWVVGVESMSVVFILLLFVVFVFVTLGEVGSGMSLLNILATGRARRWILTVRLEEIRVGATGGRLGPQK